MMQIEAPKNLIVYFLLGAKLKILDSMCVVNLNN